MHYEIFDEEKNCSNSGLWSQPSRNEFQIQLDAELKIVVTVTKYIDTQFQVKSHIEARKIKKKTPK